MDLIKQKSSIDNIFRKSDDNFDINYGYLRRDSQIKFPTFESNNKFEPSFNYIKKNENLNRIIQNQQVDCLNENGFNIKSENPSSFQINEFHKKNEVKNLQSKFFRTKKSLFRNSKKSPLQIIENCMKKKYYQIPSEASTFNKKLKDYNVEELKYQIFKMKNSLPSYIKKIVRMKSFNRKTDPELFMPIKKK